jgi:DNA polymerase I-like protein with 3'-5' exonuclease and polymerase domains
VKRRKRLISGARAEAENLVANAILAEFPAQGSELGATELANLQDEIRRAVAQGAVAIVQSAVERAKETSQYQLIKFLFEIAGLYPAGPKESETKELSLARMLCRELGLPENPELETQAGETGEKEERPADCHTVK